METGFALSEIDTTTPHPARMHDALLGGCHQPASACQVHHVKYGGDRRRVRLVWSEGQALSVYWPWAVRG